MLSKRIFHKLLCFSSEREKKKRRNIVCYVLQVEEIMKKSNNNVFWGDFFFWRIGGKLLGEDGGLWKHIAVLKVMCQKKNLIKMEYL